jgi:DNA replication and repair protein RecF
MLLAEIEATNFRNLSGKIVWGSNLNIIYGNNGQGKTNWLEAIYLWPEQNPFARNDYRKQSSLASRSRVEEGNERQVGRVTIERDLQVTLHDNSKTIFVNPKREPLTRYFNSTTNLFVYGKRS